jgi:uncharacterized protein DUF6794
MARSLASAALLLFLGGTLSTYAAVPAIPRNLSEAQESLARHLSAADIARARELKSEEDIVRVVNMPLTIALTNEWRLWAGSPLARYFKRLGVAEPHDMIGVVAETYWCKLHGRPFALRAKVAKLRKYYAREEVMKPKGRSPRDGAEIDWFRIMQSRTGTLYLGASLSDGSFWRYDHRNGRGIEPARPAEVKELQEIQEMTKKSPH